MQFRWAWRPTSWFFRRGLAGHGFNRIEKASGQRFEIGARSSGPKGTMLHEGISGLLPRPTGGGIAVPSSSAEKPTQRSFPSPWAEAATVQLGAVDKSANKRIFTVLFAIRRGKQCKMAYIYSAFCNLESKQVQISLYLLWFLQFGELKSAKWLIFTVLFAIWRGKQCKIVYIYCAFCNSESYKVQHSLYLLCFLQLLQLSNAN